MVAVRTLWGPITGITQLSISMTLTQQLNDADNSAALICQVEKDGTIDHVGVYITALVGNPSAYNVGLVTVDASGLPTTSAYGSSAIESYDFTATGWHDVTLATPATASAGDVFAIRVWPTGSAPDGSNNVTVRICEGSSSLSGLRLPQGARYTTSWAKLPVAVPSMSYRYSDEAWALTVASDILAGTPFDSADSPDEYGATFTVPFACTCFGLRVCVTPPSAGNTWTATLYDGDGSPAATVDSDLDTNSSFFDVFFDGVSLTADTTYRIGITNSSASATMRVNRISVAAAATRAGWIEGADWQGADRADAGAWTDRDTIIPIMGLWLSDITTAGGGIAGSIFGGAVVR